MTDVWNILKTVFWVFKRMSAIQISKLTDASEESVGQTITSEGTGKNAD